MILRIDTEPTDEEIRNVNEAAKELEGILEKMGAGTMKVAQMEPVYTAHLLFRMLSKGEIIVKKAHYTGEGSRAEVIYQGQQYEILVNPIRKEKSDGAIS